MNSFNPNPNILKEQRELFSKEAKQMSADGFGVIYSDFATEMERVAEINRIHSQNKTEDMIGFEGEKLVINRLNRQILGEGIDIYKSDLADDVLRGCDAFIVSPRFHVSGEPVVVGIDITLNQANEDDKRIRHQEKDGLEKKLERIVRRVDSLSRIDPALARDFNAWISSGGLSRERPKDSKDPNYKFWKLSDEVIQARYFRNPADDPVNPNMPHPVIAGPRAVLSLDAVFFNKANLDNKYIRGVDINQQIDTVLRAETYMSLNHLLEYMNKLIKNKPQMNSIFDAYYSATKAWVDLLDQPGRVEIFKGAFNEIAGRDKLVRSQMDTYSKALKKAFGV